MKIYSWNINGIRSIQAKGFSSWLKIHSPDIICLQEIKADPSVIPAEYLSLPGYKTFFLSAQKKGYSGVMTLSKYQPLETIFGLRNYKNEGRTLIHIFEKYILINSYFPNGGREHERVDFKMNYCRAILNKMKLLQKKYNKPIIICGDFNTAHHEVDLKNHKTNKKTSGFLEIERTWLDKLEKSGMSDVFRQLNPNKTDIYSWWSYRNNCRCRNIGWRIDYFWANNKLLKSITQCQYLPQSLGSDHCPLFLELNERNI